jgi:hypothetical protein
MKHMGRVLMFIVMLTGAAALHAQETQITGQVRDSSQASVAGARVTLTRAETGDHREITSGAEGYYTFPLLLPGHYSVKVEKEGFDTQNETGIVVETGNVSTVNVSLKVGSTTQTVDVDASVPLLQTETSAVAQVVENASITNLPLVDRRSAQLQRLNGFVVQTNSGSSASFAIAGGRANNADYLIDGGTAQNLQRYSNPDLAKGGRRRCSPVASGRHADGHRRPARRGGTRAESSGAATPAVVSR